MGASTATESRTCLDLKIPHRERVATPGGRPQDDFDLGLDGALEDDPRRHQRRPRAAGCSKGGRLQVRRARRPWRSTSRGCDAASGRLVDSTNRAATVAGMTQTHAYDGDGARKFTNGVATGTNKSQVLR